MPIAFPFVLHLLGVYFGLFVNGIFIVSLLLDVINLIWSLFGLASLDDFFAFSSQVPILVYSPSFIILASYELVKMAKHNLVVPLGFKKHLGFGCVELLKQSENLPQTQCNPNSFQFKLKKLCIYFFFDKNVCRNLLNFIFFIAVLVSFPVLMGKSYSLPYFIFKVLLQFNNAIRGLLNWIFNVVCNLIGNNWLIDFKVVDLLRGRTLQVLAKRSNVNLLVPIQIKELTELII